MKIKRKLPANLVSYVDHLIEKWYPKVRKKTRGKLPKKMVPWMDLLIEKWSPKLHERVNRKLPAHLIPYVDHLIEIGRTESFHHFSADDQSTFKLLGMQPFSPEHVPKLPIDQMIFLYKGLVLSDAEFRPSYGSVSSIPNFFKYINEYFWDVDDGTTIRALYKFAAKRTLNDWIPTGRHNGQYFATREEILQATQENWVLEQEVRQLRIKRRLEKVLRRVRRKKVKRERDPRLVKIGTAVYDPDTHRLYHTAKKQSPKFSFTCY